MAKSDTLVIDLNSGADTGAAIPSIAEMISESIAKPENNGAATSLDDLHIEFSTPKIAADNSQALPRRRGRPPNNDATPKERPHAKRKAELVSEVEKLQSELASERARHDTGAVKQLATSIEMAAHLVFGFAAEARGAHWAITQDEANSIGETGAVALAPYAESMSAQLPWILFAGAIGKVIFTRVQMDRALVAKLQAPVV